MAFKRSWVQFPSPPLGTPWTRQKKLPTEWTRSRSRRAPRHRAAEARSGTAAHEGGPDFHELFGEEKTAKNAEKPPAEQVDTTKKAFPIIVKLEEEPKPYFQDKDFYKKVLAGEGETGTAPPRPAGQVHEGGGPRGEIPLPGAAHLRVLGPRVQRRLPGKPGAHHRPSACSCASASFPRGSSPPSCGTWSRKSSRRTTPASRSTMSTNGWR